VCCWERKIEHSRDMASPRCVRGHGRWGWCLVAVGLLGEPVVEEEKEQQCFGKERVLFEVVRVA
jgi:hypothetical protein